MVLAAKVLDKYMQDFQRRNPTLRVFSAYLHMDEATPHLHTDFVPYTTGSKRVLDTRVSLKQALVALGFKGGTGRETELNQWVTYSFTGLIPRCLQRLRKEKLGQDTPQLAAGWFIRHIWIFQISLQSCKRLITGNGAETSG